MTLKADTEAYFCFDSSCPAHVFHSLEKAFKLQRLHFYSYTRVE